MYGPQLELPQFFEGSFDRALEAARRDRKLVVVYLNSAGQHEQLSRTFCTDVLGCQGVREILDQNNDNFVVWGSDTARMESLRVAQTIGAQGFPVFSVILVASLDDVRVIGRMEGDMQVDSVLALLTLCIDDLEMHRSEMVARDIGFAENRRERELQDEEYRKSLEEQQKIDEERQRKAEQVREELRKEDEKVAEARRQETERQRQELEEAERLEAAKQELLDQRRKLSLELPAEGPDATARIAMRLPGGQRLQRKFRPTATLTEVYTWAQVAAALPENEGKGLEIPARFTLKTSNPPAPPRDLTEKDRTIGDLQLAGSVLLLTELEDDDLSPAMH